MLPLRVESKAAREAETGASYCRKAERAMTPAEFLERHAPPPARIRTQHDQMNLAQIERDFPFRSGSTLPAAESDHGIRNSVSPQGPSADGT